MKYLSSLVNALLLVVVGIWGYIAGGSVTALIPVAFGLILLILYPSVKKEAMVPAHLAVLLTLIVTIALFKPLNAAWIRSDGPAIFRTALMFTSSAFALICFIKSFSDVRRARKLKEEGS